MAQHKPVSPTVYAAVYVTLLALTGLTVWVAATFRLGPWEVPVALGIASVKTVLIGLIFMHLNHASKLVWLALGAAVLFFAIMIGLMMADYGTRGWVPGRGEDPVTRGI
ncbi:MAG: cytochrome C oxidase subunit IV family protein [Gemmataceae bacterium]